jgi:hypothetical protein
VHWRCKSTANLKFAIAVMSFLIWTAKIRPKAKNTVGGMELFDEQDEEAGANESLCFSRQAYLAISVRPSV